MLARIFGWDRKVANHPQHFFGHLPMGGWGIPTSPCPSKEMPPQSAPSSAGRSLHRRGLRAENRRGGRLSLLPRAGAWPDAFTPFRCDSRMRVRMSRFSSSKLIFPSARSAKITSSHRSTSWKYPIVKLICFLDSTFPPCCFTALVIAAQSLKTGYCSE